MRVKDKKFERFKEFFNSQPNGRLPPISQISIATRLSYQTIRNYLIALSLEGKVKIFIADGKISQIYKVGNIENVI